MERFLRAMRQPGAQKTFECAAPTQMVIRDTGQVEKQEGLEEASVHNIDTYIVAAKPRLLDRWLDNVVRFSGSQVTFFTILGGLFAWAFLGIPFGQKTDWQIAISDVQAILNIIFDSFLMRQQLNTYHELLIVLSCLRSRAASNKKMLAKLVEAKDKEMVKTQLHELGRTTFTSELPPENLLGRICTAFSSFMGHIATIVAFWVCIFVWIGFGPYCGWSNRWQLYINSATSALMLFLLAFLANIRERHNKHTARCLTSIYKIDAGLELKLRAATKYVVPNDSVLVPAPQVARVQRGINYYADLVGTLIGIAILMAVMVIWVLVGPVMKFGSNWWLLIGTYAGLVGMNDGFVLRNVNNKQQEHEDVQFDQLMGDDLEMLAIVGIEQPAEERVAKFSLTARISIAVGKIFSHEYTVVVGVVSILGLVVGASAMGWSLTGQLLCNIPPSIVESFFTMILITGHNIGEAKRRVDLHNVYLRRLKLVTFADKIVRTESANISSSVLGGVPITAEKVDVGNSSGDKIEISS